jgi:hypothetical protein
LSDDLKRILNAFIGVHRAGSDGSKVRGSIEADDIKHVIGRNSEEFTGIIPVNLSLT